MADAADTAPVTCPCGSRHDVHEHDVTGILTLELPPLDLPIAVMPCVE